MKTIGNISTFAFEIGEPISPTLHNISLHVGSQQITNEPVYRPSYTFCLEQFIHQLEVDFYAVSDAYFHIPKKELLQVLIEAQKFALPLDETIDHCCITIVQFQERVKITWTPWDNVSDVGEVLDKPVNQVLTTKESLIHVCYETSQILKHTNNKPS